MPWLERPAAVYTDLEVVLHRMDTASLIEKDGSTYEVWSLRIRYRFDATSGKWSHTGSTAKGYRRQTRQGPEIETPLPVGHADLVRLHAPRWIPDPSKPPSEMTLKEAQSVAVVSKGPRISEGMSTALKAIRAEQDDRKNADG